MSGPAARNGTLLVLDTATSRVVVARGGFDGTLEDAAGWPAGTSSRSMAGRSDSPCR